MYKDFHTFVCFMSRYWCQLNKPCKELDFCHYNVLLIYSLVVVVMCLIMYMLHELWNELVKWINENDNDLFNGNNWAHQLLDRLH